MSDYGIRPVRHSISVVPHDTNPILDTLSAGSPPIRSRGVSVSGSGDVAFVDEEGISRIAKGLAAGLIHPISTTIIKSTLTTATGIVAYW